MTRSENLNQWLAGILPRKVVYFAYIRLLAAATSGKHGDQGPCDVSWTEALKRWERGPNHDRPRSSDPRSLNHPEEAT